MRPTHALLFACLLFVSRAAIGQDKGPPAAHDAGTARTRAAVDAGSAAAPDAGAPRRFALRGADLPESVKPAGAGRIKGRVLADATTLGAKTVSLVELTFEGAVPRAFHRHPGAELLVVLEGQLTLDAPGGTKVLEAGDAAFLPAGGLHGLSRPDAQPAPAAGPTRVLALYAPPGPEQSYRGKRDAPFTIAVRRSKPSKADLAGPQAIAIARKQVKPVTIAQGNGSATLLLERDTTGGNASAYAGWLELGAGATVPRHVHSDEEELLYVVAGTAEMVVGGQKELLAPGSVVHIPANTPHSANITSKEALVAVQFYAPGGPEQRFKAPPKLP